MGSMSVVADLNCTTTSHLCPAFVLPIGFCLSCHPPYLFFSLCRMPEVQRNTFLTHLGESLQLNPSAKISLECSHIQLPSTSFAPRVDISWRNFSRQHTPTLVPAQWRHCNALHFGICRLSSILTQRLHCEALAFNSLPLPAVSQHEYSPGGLSSQHTISL